VDKASTRKRAVEHLTKLVEDCTEALGATDIWADYEPRDRIRSQGLFSETRDVANRLLAALEADAAISRADWQRVMPHEAEWNDVFKILHAQVHE
jgi:hypothetical protein